MKFFTRIARNYRAIRSWYMLNWLGAAVLAVESAFKCHDIEGAQ